MTEKDSLEEVTQEPQDLQEEAESQVEEQAPETKMEPEAESDFLAQWKERHQAYLASQQEVESEQEEVKPEEKAPAHSPKLSQKVKTKKVKDANSIRHSQDLEVKPVVTRTPIPRKALLQAVPIIAVAMMGILLAVYFISPLSKEKKIEVVGNQRIDTETVLRYSRISSKDYALTTLLETKNIEDNIKHSSNVVKSDQMTFQFPNRFTIHVEEFTEVGYLKDKDGYRLVLSSGNISETAMPLEALPEQHTLINLTNKDLVKELALQLATIDSEIVRNIESIDLTPSKVTTDLLTMTMHDGNTLIIPLSEIDTKLPYYPNIAKRLFVPSVVDMEVGAFSYTK
ncbi:cell division protein FtsQ/DivIB [Streptococcus respiraculi]|uniref:cell division protein FtsQ/DivIB n=1 Tax=Streptococcus respiraculi TaxID=2021971 RepID=UPI000E72ACEE|nr:FtsQ-type POTRA domain-containing protein [Streptococcus respiraculi]